jgi:hypothetical protein
MSSWNPVWKVILNGGLDYTNLTLSNLTITSGRTDIYSQPVPGYCSVTIINTDESAIPLDINDDVLIQVKDSTGTFVNLFGGTITDLDIAVNQSGTLGTTEKINIKAYGTLSKLSKFLTDGVLSKDYDGNQIYSILAPLLYDTWDEVPPALEWQDYDPTITWANAGNSGIGEIDRPGDFELTARSAAPTTVYSLISSLATSGLGYIYENASGQICYADSTHRGQYLSSNGYVDVTGNHAIAPGLHIAKRAGDVRNKVKIIYKNDQTVEDSDLTSIALYGELGYNISTTLENEADAETQAAFYLTLRSYPEFMLRSITFPIASPEIDNADRDALLNIFMGLPLNVSDLPNNMLGGSFQGFVEGWTWQATQGALSLTINLSPIAYSLPAFKWMDVPATETWATVSPTLDWNNATIVA